VKDEAVSPDNYGYQQRSQGKGVVGLHQSINTYVQETSLKGEHNSAAIFKNLLTGSVPDSDSFFYGSGSRQQKTNFSKAKSKYWEKI